MPGSLRPSLFWVVTLCLSSVSAVYIRPVVFPNGTIGVEVIETDDKIVTPGDTSNPEGEGIDMNAFEFPLTKNDVDWLSSLLRLPEQGELRIRKEYRVLTDKERYDFHLALNTLKNDRSVSLNKYDLLANIHSRSSANKAAHAGPGFLGWHRVFLMMMENALRQACPNVTVPYWDVTLDERMDKPYQSVIWSSDFLGSGHGPVSEGPFKHWEVPFGFGHLERLVSAQGRLFSYEDIKKIMSRKRLAEISYFSADQNANLEALHNRVHVWVGGQMRKIEIGAFDPIFYLLHSFVDQIWEDFRSQQRREGVDPQKDYPQLYGRGGHAPLAPMGLGSIGVIDGLSDIWSNRVQYRTRPTCNATTTKFICDSPYLKCNSGYLCVSISKTVAMASTSMSNQINIDAKNISNKFTTSQENLSDSDSSLTSGTRVLNSSRNLAEHETRNTKDATSSRIVIANNMPQGTINITARDYLRYILPFNMYTDNFNSLRHNYQYPTLELFD